MPELLNWLQTKVLLADKAYDSDKIVQASKKHGLQFIITCQVDHKKDQRVLNQYRYKARHLIKNLFQRKKIFCRVATRFDRLDVTFLGFVHIVDTINWLR